eukprot:TRINITY_DN1339_c4_g1_i1.p2 TRINITY_DN1339_c4_g1~~TRINITY_DN1339_c4_g1_i1.p2  ORF type:complete len:483 (-),score=272.88 TRINITY_DN1339_c4_g1_i1:1689-3137(-)
MKNETKSKEKEGKREELKEGSIASLFVGNGNSSVSESSIADAFHIALNQSTSSSVSQSKSSNAKEKSTSIKKEEKGGKKEKNQVENVKNEGKSDVKVKGKASQKKEKEENEGEKKSSKKSLKKKEKEEKKKEESEEEEEENQVESESEEEREEEEDDEDEEESEEEKESIEEMRERRKEEKKKEKREREKENEEKRKRNGGEEDERTIFVGNVPHTIGKKASNPLKLVKTALTKLFSKCGEVESVRFRSGGYADAQLKKKDNAKIQEFHDARTTLNAYVVFKSPESVAASLKMNGEDFHGFNLRVDTTLRRNYNSNFAVFVGNIPYNATENQLREHFLPSGAVKSVRIVRDKIHTIGQGFGFVEFENEESVDMALELNDLKLNGRPLRVTRCHRKPKVKEGGLKKAQEEYPAGRRIKQRHEALRYKEAREKEKEAKEKNEESKKRKPEGKQEEVVKPKRKKLPTSFEGVRAKPKKLKEKSKK